MNIPRAPSGTGPTGRRLWRDVLAEFELTGADLVLLGQAAQCADRIAALEAEAGDRPTVQGARGGRVTNPAIREARQQSLLMARLLAALRVVAAEDGSFARGSQRRVGFRGVYGLFSVGDDAG
jgi:hypothetical protein